MARKAPSKRAIRKRLLDEKARLEEELAESEERTSKTAEQETAAGVSGYENHPGDVALETSEREKDFAMAESVESMLQRVKNALDKLDRNTYGLCDSCGKPIAAERLEALPFATLCVHCQQRTEIR